MKKPKIRIIPSSELHPDDLRPSSYMREHESLSDAHVLCGRCQRPLSGPEALDPERCWVCFGGLCVACWDAHGECGHSEAELAQRRSKLVGNTLVKNNLDQ